MDHVVLERRILILNWMGWIISQQSQFISNNQDSAEQQLYKACSFPSLAQCIEFNAKNPLHEDWGLQHIRGRLKMPVRWNEFSLLLEQLIALSFVCKHTDKEGRTVIHWMNEPDLRIAILIPR